jgi:hypothetical protein
VENDTTHMRVVEIQQMAHLAIRHRRIQQAEPPPTRVPCYTGKRRTAVPAGAGTADV